MFVKLTLVGIAIALVPWLVKADDIAVTVYNSNLGVVSETRSLEFDKGVNQLAYTDVPARIDATSVRFDVLGTNGDITILEQNYAFDLVSADKIYEKHLDEKIDLVSKDGQVYTGILLAQSSDAITLQDDKGAIKLVSRANIAEVNFPVLPEGLTTRPTLFWLYGSETKGTFDTRVSYQTSGLSWSAEYVGVLDAKEKNLDLSGWSSINNQSGKTYKNAKLRLIAGEISRAQKMAPPGMMRSMELAADMPRSAGFEEKAFFEYHMYTLPRSATVADKEIKQVSLFDPAGSSVEKVYRFHAGSGSNDVEVAIKFKNSEKTGLGMPLPAGRVRMFKADDDGSLILLGEDRIDHTPKDEELNIKVGSAFDVIGEEKLLSRNRVSAKVEDQVFEIELRNHKDESITVSVEKRLYGFWEITQSNFEYRKKDANTVIFDIPVDADETVTVSFTARFSNR